jgi:hypothetical protein
MLHYVPLSQRPSREIMARGEMYQAMAATARMPEAKRGPELLAVRLAALADRRESVARPPAHRLHNLGLSSPAR